MVRVDQGVGVGLVLDGALYRGSRSASGEIGHVVVDPDGSICACGSGCLETEITAPLLGRRLGAAGGAGEIEILRPPASGSAPRSPPCSARSTSAT